MILQRVAFLHIATYLHEATVTVDNPTGHAFYLVEIPREDLVMPYGIVYPVGVSLRPDAPLEVAPNPFSTQVQVTAVGRSPADAEFLIGACAIAMETITPCDGAGSALAEMSVAPQVGASEGVTARIARWNVKFAE